MAIPRHFGNNTPKPETREPKINEDTFNPFFLDDEEEGEIDMFPDLEELDLTFGDQNDAFETINLPPMSEAISPETIENLNDDDLDSLLGLDDLDITPQDLAKAAQTAPNHNNAQSLTGTEQAPTSTPQTPTNTTPAPQEDINNETNEENELNFDFLSDFEDQDHSDEISALINSKPKETTVPEEEPENISFDLDDFNFTLPDTDTTELPENDEIVFEIDNNQLQYETEDDDDNFTYENTDDDEDTDDDNDISKIDFASLISFDDDENDDEEEDDETWGFEKVSENSEESDESFTFSPIDDWNEDDDEDDAPEQAQDEQEWANSVPAPIKRTKTPPVQEEGAEEPLNEPEEESSDSLIDKLKKKFTLIKAQVIADAKGESIPTQKDVDNDIPDYAKPLPEEDGDEDDDEELRDIPNPNKKKPKGKKSKQKKAGIFSLITKPYKLLTDFIFGILIGAFGFLSKIPIIGRLFRPILAATKILKKISGSFPILLLIGVMVAVSYFSVPRSSDIELPDEGSATFSGFAYEEGKVTGTIENTGYVIANLEATFTVHTLQPTINPLSWFIPKEAATCSSELLTVDIDSIEEVTSTCSEVDGYIPRVSGELSE